MAPASGKRKRPERQSAEDDGSRASPYRPEKSRMVARRASQSNGTDQEMGGASTATSAVANGDTPGANGASLLEPPASSADTPTPGLETTPNPEGSAYQSGDVAMDQRAAYPYSVVTDELVATWNETGNAALSDSANTMDDYQVSGLLQELIRSTLDGRLSAKQAGHFVRDLRSSRQSCDGLDVDFLFLNTISFLYDAGYRGESLKTLVAASGIDQQTMRLAFDIGLVQDLGLARSTFEKMRTRKTTNMLYRQANFNLMREESEGYAKLITEYFNTAQEASTRHVEDPYMAENAFQRIMALVGAFDLDVGRVLDITLDVCANLLVRAYPFFMKFYRASSWWPKNELLDNVKWKDQGFDSLPAWALPESGRSTASDEERKQLAVLRQQRDVLFWEQVRALGTKAFFELGAKKITDFESALLLLETEAQPDLDSRGKEYNPDKRQRINEARKYMKETGCIPPPGNYDAAQLLGFKLRFYASDARDANDILPDNLIYLAALLIKIGFISLRDLYPHLYPLDKDMATEKERLMKEKVDKEAKDRPGGGINALLTAGALSDDAPPPRMAKVEKEKSGGATPAQDKKDEPKEELPPPANQKLQLLKALLLIGAIPEALFILGRFPWLAEVDVTLPPFLFRIVKHMLSKMSDFVLPLADQEDMQISKDQLYDTSPQGDSTLPFTTRAPRKILRWLHNDGFDKDGVEYRHYYGEWSDNVPVCQSLEDVHALCDSFLGYLGPKIGQDSTILTTLLRLAHHSLTEDTSENNRSRWLILMRRLLIPALSCGKHNPQLTHQVFELLKMWPTATRYGIYAEWFLGSTSRHPDVRVAFARNKSEVRDVLRRVSNDTVKKQGRALAKVALASPGIVVMEMISQLEAYSNMIPSLVECVRYFSPLAYDVLVWALINSLRGEGRGRRQADGMLTSAWLQAVARFVATLFARYPHLHPDPILQYLSSQLRTGDTTDLEMFDQMLVEMAGIRSDVEFNDVQVVAMAGGEALQSYIMQQLSDSRHSKEKKKSAERLVQALNGPGITGQILIAIAQERQMYPHHEESKFAPLKVLGNNVDKIAAVFAQYLDVLRTNLKADEMEAAVPDAGALATEFGLEPSIALTIRRVVLRTRITEYDARKKQEEAEEKKEKSEADSADKDGDAAMKEAASAGDPGTSVLVSPSGIKSELREESMEAVETQTLTTSPWHPVLEPVIQQLTDLLPDLAARISIPFYVTFWTLAHQDILVPTDSYQRETNRIEQQIKEIQADRSDMTTVAAKDRDKKKKDLQQWYDRLKSEPMQHMAAYMAVRNRINGNKVGNRIVPGENMFWFPKIEEHDPEKRAKKDARHIALLQECFLPRAMLSSIDAHYSFEMLKLMHANGTPGFQLMHLLNQLFKKQELAVLIFQCTAHEAQHFARFIWEVLKLLHRWHADKATYEKEALGLKKKLPGFVKTFDEQGEPKTVIDFEDFRRMLFNFHTALNNALQACFESSEYMHIRNGIILLKGIHQVFPALRHMGKTMLDQVKRLSEQDPRSDLKLAAMSLRGPLQNREKQWVMPQAFRLGKEGNGPANRGPSARPETPGADTQKLNASAPDFKPSITVDGRKESVAGGPEDGEIEDEKIAAAKKGDAEIKDAADKTKDSPKDKPPPPRPIASRDGSKTESRPNTPTPAASRQHPPASVPQRPESRSSAVRGEQNLPPRPEVPSKPLPAAPASRSGVRYPVREEHRARDEHYGRLDRPGDMRPPSRDQSPGHRSGRGRTPPGVASRGSYRDERPYDRPPSESRFGRDDGRMPRREEPPPRDMPSQPGRFASEVRDRPQLSSRQSDSNLHPDRMNHVPSVAVAPESHRSTQPPQEAQPFVNPARLANITGDSQGPSRGPRDRPNNERDLRHERDIRVDERNAPPMQPRSDSRQNGRMPPDVPRDGQTRIEPQQDPTPRGPRSGRPRTEMGPPQSESSYGRLNGPSEPPLGPKNAPGGRPARNFTAPQPINTRGNELNALSPTTTRPPESPAALRGPPRQPGSQSQQMDRQSAPSSAPSTPASEGPSVHPSRVRQFEQPAPLQTNLPTPHGPRSAASPTSAVPSGPRVSNRNGPPIGTPTGPGPANTMTPTGPASAADRQRRNERQRASINATLAGSTPSGLPGQGVQFRGASSRSTSVSQPSHSTRGGPPTLASSMELPQNQPSYDEHASGRPDLFQRADRGEERGRRHRDEDRSSRSHHGSRHQSRERHDGHSRSRQPQPPPPPQPQSQEDGRDRRQAARDDRQPREDRNREPQLREGPRSDRRPQRIDEPPPRRPMPDAPGSFNAPGQSDWQRGQQLDDVRRGRPPTGPGGRSEEFRGPGPMRREDPTNRGPMRDEGATGPDGRKRRHEEGPGPFDGVKRRRSGR